MCADYRRVLAIDVGLRNFAYCLVDTQNWREPLVWKHKDLYPAHPNRRTKPAEKEYLGIAMKWFNAHSDLFCCVDAVIFEHQLRKPFIIMNTALQALCYSVQQEVHPMTVGAFWGLPKSREQKKLRGVEVCSAYATIPQQQKQDDLADAWLMAVYGLVQAGGLSHNSLDRH